MAPPSNSIAQPGGLLLGGVGVGRAVGHIDVITFPLVASVGAGAAVTTIQQRLAIPVSHHVRGVTFGVSAATAVVAATDPALDVYRHYPVPSALTAALISPAAAGNIDNGTHHYAVTFYNAAGETTPSASVSVAVADKNVNGKVTLSNIPLAPTGATGRKIYRTAAADATALLLLATIADNTTTTYTDNIADGSLGAAAPTANTAGVTILTATKKLSETRRNLVCQPVSGALSSTEAATPVTSPACLYTLRAVTGAATGALTNLWCALEVEYLE